MVEDGEAKDLNVFIRGNVERKGPIAERRFLRVLSEGEPAPFKEGSGRKELAEAIASPQNPLTARVMVNRVWGVCFGKPLVLTPSNFGHSGQPPTHPELLDDLAVRFTLNGWSVKSLAREMVLSSTYRQRSTVEPLNRLTVKAENTTGAASSRFNASTLRRFNEPRAILTDPANGLAIEQWRDTILFASGALEWTGGKSLELDDPKNVRRTVYTRISRLKLNDLLMQFDYPDANVHAEKRAVTTTPMQKLFMLNSGFMIEQAKLLAARLTANPKDTDPTRIQQAYRLLFGREPEKAESKVALEFLRKPAATDMSRWDEYAQVLLTSNEMLYVD
ncbi:MAG: hypothetical protein DME26_12650 [Verrucomicrobia bacterium]|nr:MAG: hypothetical protein DME26_12650 [Verrucomicrobiota bacterium]